MKSGYHDVFEKKRIVDQVSSDRSHVLVVGRRMSFPFTTYRVVVSSVVCKCSFRMKFII